MATKSTLVVLFFVALQIFSTFASTIPEGYTNGEYSTASSEATESAHSSDSTTYHVDDAPLQNNFTKSENRSTVCYGVLGCFGIYDFFDPISRPIVLEPQSPETINVTYSLYTAQNKYKPVVLSYNLTEEEIVNSPFDPKKPSKFIIHGFGGSFDDMQWMGDIKDLFLALAPDKFNIFGVDWSRGTDTIVYMQAVANTRVVGAATAHFINKLVEFTNTRIEDIHLIGHSLGAHVSGHIGERFTDPKIGRLTALDPAGPEFYKNNPKSRLDSTDAAYVEVIHTDYGNLLIEGLGLEDAVGHDDYYPNSGYRQPGCGITKGVFNVLSKGIGSGITKTVACNHQRSWKFYLVDPDTLGECQFVGYECKNYDDFLSGKCGDCGHDNSKCGIFGFLGRSDPVYGRFSLQQEIRAKSSNETRKLYFKTSDKTPFCLFHYQITIRFDQSMSRSATGFIKMDLHGSKRNVNDVEMDALLVKEIKSFEPGHNYTKLFTCKKNLGSVDSITLKWQFGGAQLLDPTKLFSFPKLKIANIEVKYMSNIDPKVRSNYSTILCPTSDEEIKSGNQGSFERCKFDARSESDSSTTQSSGGSNVWPF
ncbi:pancreatic lipase-related protein 2-like protein [Dinothrombium tinctorium]|uniref:Pancreatic lipase-related protein 2-like protein n=1 Tax=Dinothrombium tinctorium TaxID=1965070 RepID=A0A443QHP9_9ACAR|nr:pancreatic lipase-related protein 2-like protein [Dinothrombium tinctorium]